MVPDEASGITARVFSHIDPHPPLPLETSPTGEWDEFLAHFEKCEVELGNCGPSAGRGAGH